MAQVVLLEEMVQLILQTLEALMQELLNHRVWKDPQKTHQSDFTFFSMK